ncbi:MAG TPA: VOC family protein, partial [Pseudoneobacillus sp.]|nr:VOC family protein [Pseudoneobacillus sp.]
SGSEDFQPKKKYNQNSIFQLTNYIAVQVKDYEKALNFYENIIGMKLQRSFKNETKFTIGGNHFFIENSEDGNVFFEYAVDNFHHAIEMLLDYGCEITKEYHEKSVMVSDPFGMMFHLFEVKK